MPKKFVSFYLHFREHRQVLEYLCCQFYRQMLDNLRLYNNEDFLVNIDNGRIQRTVVPEDLDERTMVSKDSDEYKDDFILFRGEFMKVIEDGTLLFVVIKNTLLELGMDAENIILKREGYRLRNVFKASLRALCSYVDNNFLPQLPPEYQVAFAVDCLLYSEWRMNHPNLLALHMVVIAWIFGVKQFERFIPEGLRSCPALTNPLLKIAIPTLGFQFSFGDPAQVAAKPAQVAAKPAQVAAKPAQVTAKPAQVTAKPAQVAAKPAQVAAKPPAKQEQVVAAKPKRGLKAKLARLKLKRT